ncbi:MAG: MaoC family dehydratase [Betaproteobacteria bacterium]|nr:MaoC family dehydratase [Betaproteobacteria bacterium]
MAYKFYFEDFKAGDVIAMGARTLEKHEIIAFARQFDPQPFHIDEEAAKESVFGGIVASGWHTCALVMRMMCDSHLNECASLGSPGLDNIRWLKPVRPGDTIHARRVILETRVSQSKPGTGIIKSRWEVINQLGELVMTMEGFGMFGRRGQEDSSS